MLNHLRPHRIRAGRRPDEDRPRRGGRCAARGGRVRLCHRAAGRGGLHHDAQVPPQHLPGGRGRRTRCCAKFTGKPEHVINYFFFVAEEARQIMAQLGIRQSSTTGRPRDLLDTADGPATWKARAWTSAACSACRRWPGAAPPRRDRGTTKPRLGARRAPDRSRRRARPLARRCSSGRCAQRQPHAWAPMLSGELIRRHPEGLPDQTIHPDGGHGRAELRRLAGARASPST